MGSVARRCPSCCVRNSPLNQPKECNYRISICSISSEFGNGGRMRNRGLKLAANQYSSNRIADRDFWNSFRWTVQTALRIPYRAEFLRLSGFQSERLGAVELKSSWFLRAILDLSLERFNPLHHPASCCRPTFANVFGRQFLSRLQLGAILC